MGIAISQKMKNFLNENKITEDLEKGNGSGDNIGQEAEAWREARHGSIGRDTGGGGSGGRGNRAGSGSGGGSGGGGRGWRGGCDIKFTVNFGQDGVFVLYNGKGFGFDDPAFLVRFNVRLGSGVALEAGSAWMWDCCVYCAHNRVFKKHLRYLQQSHSWRVPRDRPGRERR